MGLFDNYDSTKVRKPHKKLWIPIILFMVAILLYSLLKPRYVDINNVYGAERYNYNTEQVKDGDVYSYIDSEGNTQQVVVSRKNTYIIVARWRGLSFRWTTCSPARSKMLRSSLSR